MLQWCCGSSRSVIHFDSHWYVISSWIEHLCRYSWPWWSTGFSSSTVVKLHLLVFSEVLIIIGWKFQQYFEYLLKYLTRLIGFCSSPLTLSVFPVLWLPVQQPSSHRPSTRSGTCTSCEQTKVTLLLPAALQTLPGNCVTTLLYTQLIKRWLHTLPYQAANRGDVIWSWSWNANIPREVHTVCLRQASGPLRWSSFLLSAGRSDRDRL